MEELIEALTIMAKYMEGVKYPTHCEHDVLLVCVKWDDISEEDQKRLDELSFKDFPEYGCVGSFKFGSA